MADNKFIRRASFDDVEAIYDVIRDNPAEVLPRSYQDIFTHVDRFHVYDDGGVQGVISWEVLPLVNTDVPDRCIEVISFSVRRGQQKMGVGSLLLEHVLGVIGRMAPDRVIVLTFHPAFFRRFGFVETSKENLYQKILVGCLNCVKHKSPLTCPEVAMELVLSK